MTMLESPPLGLPPWTIPSETVKSEREEYDSTLPGDRSTFVTFFRTGDSSSRKRKLNGRVSKLWLTVIVKENIKPSRTPTLRRPVVRTLPPVPIQEQLLESFQARIEEIEEDVASVSLCDTSGIPSVLLRIPREDLDQQEVPFASGEMFEFRVYQEKRPTGNTERFEFRPLRRVFPDPKVLLEEQKRIRAAFDDNGRG